MTQNQRSTLYDVLSCEWKNSWNKSVTRLSNKVDSKGIS
ncbi:hypothetical protein URH17368_0274 [Alicyclobacillus hesperidum URH17-3-68]|nr:hypothetical protein URH17368_0274 [Alicyclobacillus hesperidum URH17-3-68]